MFYDEYHVILRFLKEVLPLSQTFSGVRVLFSAEGERFTSSPPINYSHSIDRIFETAQNISINLHGSAAKFVKLQFFFSLRWLMISEISFDSGKLKPFFVQTFLQNLSGSFFFFCSSLPLQKLDRQRRRAHRYCTNNERDTSRCPSDDFFLLGSHAGRTRYSRGYFRGSSRRSRNLLLQEPSGEEQIKDPFLDFLGHEKGVDENEGSSYQYELIPLN